MMMQDVVIVLLSLLFAISNGFLFCSSQQGLVSNGTVLSSTFLGAVHPCDCARLCGSVDVCAAWTFNRGTGNVVLIELRLLSSAFCSPLSTILPSRIQRRLPKSAVRNLGAKG
jgi:hypothetical protein